ncbi:MAG TPA: TrkA C-terminal domain-containing protein [Anaerolineae bacterium]|nr:TrkA C-terminal domain-containing protein [Anaerolineae bacterium]
MRTYLLENPLLLLFLVSALGYWVGQIPLWGNRMGMAAVLLVGLGFGAWEPALDLPDAFLNLGLVLFAYTIGLSNGAGFFAKFRREGMREVLFVVGSLLLPAGLLLGVAWWSDLSAASLAGVFTGMGNNTPALASTLDYINRVLPVGERGGAVAAAVVGFSVVYPLGVVGRMLVLVLAGWWWEIDYEGEAYALRKQYPVAEALQYRTVVVTKEEIGERPLRHWQAKYDWEVIFGRVYRAAAIEKRTPQGIGLAGGDSFLQVGDWVIMAGTAEALDKAEADLGEVAPEDLLHDRAVYESRYLFVSNPDMAGQPLQALDLRERYGAMISHVRRGDTELLARRETVLEWGDRVRILAPRSEMERLVALFGDSYVKIGQVNLLTMGLGITMGLLLGQVPLPLPGGLSFRLGIAGGPLLVALILGAWRRTGPILWTLPYSASVTLQQFGLICLLATVGVRSGGALLAAFTGGMGWLLLALGLVLVMGTTWVSLWVGYKLLSIPYSLLVGMISPQPAVLGFALEQTGNGLPNVGYTLMFPFAIIMNVTLAQLLLFVLQGG